MAAAAGGEKRSTKKATAAAVADDPPAPYYMNSSATTSPNQRTRGGRMQRQVHADPRNTGGGGGGDCGDYENPSSVCSHSSGGGDVVAAGGAPGQRRRHNNEDPFALLSPISLADATSPSLKVESWCEDAEQQRSQSPRFRERERPLPSSSPHSPKTRIVRAATTTGELPYPHRGGKVMTTAGVGRAGSPPPKEMINAIPPDSNRSSALSGSRGLSLTRLVMTSPKSKHPRHRAGSAIHAEELLSNAADSPTPNC